MDKEHYKLSPTFKILKKSKDMITISLAARATSAAPTFFPEVNFPTLKPHPQLNDEDKRSNLVFYQDGGLLNSNPNDQLSYTRYELVDHVEPSPRISCVISCYQSCHRAAESPASACFQLIGVVSSVMDFSTYTNAKAKDFTRHMERLNSRLKEKIGLADYTRFEGDNKELS